MRKNKKISINWPIKSCICWTILSLVILAFCLIHFAVIDSSYANNLVDDVLAQVNQNHSTAQKGTVNLTKDAISIAYQLGRLDFATFAITFVTVVIAIAGFAAFAGIKATAIETTEKKILELLDDPDFENKIRFKMSEDIHSKVNSVVTKLIDESLSESIRKAVNEKMEMKETLENQKIGTEFDDYLSKEE